MRWSRFSGATPSVLRFELNLAAGLALGALVLAGASTPAVTVTPKPLAYVDVPAGVHIPVKMDERISSQEAITGQPFHFEVTDDTDVGSIKVRSGTPGIGTVELAESHRGVRGGRLEVTVDHLQLRDGRAISVVLPPDPDTPGDTGVVVVLGGKLGGDNVVLEKGAGFVVVTGAPPTPLPIPTALPSST
jgi:hypothetical protein